ncbi:methylmalonyl-CoA mutase [Ulvibacter sp. MAR_2010_11]|uniref:methylmalonyl-CoA mutase subunit beta n=1 Tax=Ulvibacter sp. MAR_2010_11 TaxID=1250229 RepID=UPI000C2CAF70|nr:methylmalonyl-CoA mutase subunit beta [Ulvibacter sp. MAR_2010_11]PKA83811.1 methylmalonyl-CoA mutase [Ulvibacter sp. MAR_2010_11]
MSEFLFDEFQPVSAKQWKQKIQYDLKGADYNEALVWQSNEGIHVKPFYHNDDFKEDFSPVPGHPESWKIGQHVFIDDEVIANRIALDTIARGAEAIVFTSEGPFAIEKVFSGFPFEKTTIYFEWRFLSEEFILQLKQFLSAKKASVFYNIDLIGNLTRSGNWFQNMNRDHEILEVLLQKNPSENILSIDTTGYQNSGANIIQQLAYGLAHANEYLNHFQKNPSLKFNFQFAIGSNYFFEIAKIRAFRRIFAVLAKEYSINETCHLTAFPSKRNKTLYDYNVNMLRTTTECMSAVIGGANTICNLPYDAIYHKSNEFGERISRNQLLILKAESYFDAVSNPADGTYYIESLTTELAEKALALFKEIETAGGFLKLLKESTIQRKISESAQKEQQQFDTGDLILVGTNKYQHPKDLMKENLELFPFLKIKNRKTIIQPIIEKRLAEKVEQERLNNE